MITANTGLTFHVTADQPSSSPYASRPLKNLLRSGLSGRAVTGFS